MTGLREGQKEYLIQKRIPETSITGVQGFLAFVRVIFLDCAGDYRVFVKLMEVTLTRSEKGVSR